MATYTHFPFIRGDDRMMVFYGPLIRKDWLDNLGLEEPTTIDEWEQVLTAFRDKDPNQNGEQDEIPFIPDLKQIRNTNLNALIGAWGIAAGFYQVDGKVMYGEIQQEYKQFLETMQRWYEKGLIDPDFAATDTKLLDAKVTGDKIGSLYGYTGGVLGKYMGLMKDKDPEFQLIGLQHPTLEKGQTPILGQQDAAYNGFGAAITTTAANPEEIVKWLDYAYSEEGHMLFNFGIEGESYEMVDGYPKYTKKIMENPDGLPVAQALGQYVRSSYNGPFIQDYRYMEQYLSMDVQKEAIQKWSKAENKILLPPLTMTADENKKYSSIMNDVNTYAEEMVTKFIMGTEDLDQYDKFVETLKSFGIEEAISIQQAALDRYQNR